MRPFPLAVSVVLVALVATGCGSNSDYLAQQRETIPDDASQQDAADLAAELGIPEVTGESDDLYIFLPKSLDNPYWDDARLGMNAAAERLGVSAEFIGPQTTDVGQQVQMFEAAVSRRPAGIAISPNDPASVQATISAARDAGIQVIAWDSPVPDSDVQGYIGTDNTQAGRTFGENLVDELGGEGEVAVIVGSLGAVNSQQRLTGLREVIEAEPNMEIVAIEESNDSLAQATSRTEAILSVHPDVRAIVGVNGGDAPGAAVALQQQNRCGEVLVAGFDAIPQSRDLMRAECIQLLVSQRPYGMTAAGLQLLVAMANGETPAETELDTGVVAVTPETLDAFEEVVS
ncbi:ABC-type sugar transport system substrate-binding protein [Actinoalloteichus hoggarensis]|uniref:D-allose-binding periplasmic protein n=1 Tax=Actinoalloteichus hoggarensis TaxID=1470176 RepID=A0A221VWI5_9PSEU|nr:sugar-binding protein [Actinoalloteichus hoggarensis]ASO17864.1 D-allose-binding periplasmic protein precursor [Actinoalloteichus hoggarensis]MBB5924276.1 ABC-type sugar transport system substrate-binding protein [Actinoalloteichus hoggarensis]